MFRTRTAAFGWTTLPPPKPSESRLNISDDLLDAAAAMDDEALAKIAREMATRGALSSEEWASLVEKMGKDAARDLRAVAHGLMVRDAKGASTPLGKHMDDLHSIARNAGKKIPQWRQFGRMNREYDRDVNTQLHRVGKEAQRLKDFLSSDEEAALNFEKVVELSSELQMEPSALAEMTSKEFERNTRTTRRRANCWPLGIRCRRRAGTSTT